MTRYCVGSLLNFSHCPSYMSVVSSLLHLVYKQGKREGGQGVIGTKKGKKQKKTTPNNSMVLPSQCMPGQNTNCIRKIPVEMIYYTALQRSTSNNFAYDLNKNCLEPAFCTGTLRTITDGAKRPTTAPYMITSHTLCILRRSVKLSHCHDLAQQKRVKVFLQTYQ